MSARALLVVMVGVGVAAFGALTLGEYEFRGPMPWLWGLAFGVVLAQVMLAVWGRSSFVVGVVAGLFAAGALLWAAWSSTGKGLRPMPTMGWLSMGLAIVCALGWTAVSRKRERSGRQIDRARAIRSR